MNGPGVGQGVVRRDAAQPGAVGAVARVAGVFTVVAAAVLAVARLMTAETSGWWRYFGFLVAFGLLAVLAASAGLVAALTGGRRFALGLAAGFAVAAAAAVAAEPLHWRWSRDDFAGVRRGAELHCAPAGDECRLGWWRVRGAARSDEIVIVWLAVTDGCNSGRGLAAPAGDGSDPGLAGMADAARRSHASSDTVAVSAWRDGWYELCFTTSSD